MMKAKYLAGLGMLSTLLLSSCASFDPYAGPNAQVGSANGAILGAIAGGIIGNQSGRALEGAAIGAAAGSTIGYQAGTNQDIYNRQGGYASPATTPVYGRTYSRIPVYGSIGYSSGYYRGYRRGGYGRYGGCAY